MSQGNNHGVTHHTRSEKIGYRCARLSWAPVPCRNQITSTTDEASVNISNFLLIACGILDNCCASPRSTPCHLDNHVIKHWREIELNISLELKTPKKNGRNGWAPWIQRDPLKDHVLIILVKPTASIRRPTPLRKRLKVCNLPHLTKRMGLEHMPQFHPPWSMEDPFPHHVLILLVLLLSL
ncbi:hypothetical protein ZWY2020_007806 [Hordeum vulgare]|nr:hypothetical protein ZWY2020_007806 [Hordeum vulgare]